MQTVINIKWICCHCYTDDAHSVLVISEYMSEWVKIFICHEKFFIWHSIKFQLSFFLLPRTYLIFTEGTHKCDMKQFKIYYAWKWARSMMLLKLFMWVINSWSFFDKSNWKIQVFYSLKLREVIIIRRKFYMYKAILFYKKTESI